MVTRRMTTSWIAKAIFAAVAGFFVWRSRVIQVATFLAAAGVGRVRRSLASVGPGSQASQWNRLENAATLGTKLNTLALVTYHAEYHAFDPQRACKSLIAATHLGVGWVVSIFVGVKFYQTVRIHPQAISWYRSFLRFASSLGLRNMVVLSTPPRVVMKQLAANRIESWKTFVEVVALEFGKWCDAYQLMNEPNNPVYQFFSLREAAEAIVWGESIIHATAPNASIAVNVAMEIHGWQRYLTNVLELSGKSVDMVGLDHYPGTWAIGFSDHWADVVGLADKILSAQPGSPWFGRRLAILETGFSTNAFLRNEEKQSLYYEHLASLLNQLKSRSRGNGPLFGIYELCDWDNFAWLDQNVISV